MRGSYRYTMAIIKMEKASYGPPITDLTETTIFASPGFPIPK